MKTSKVTSKEHYVRLKNPGESVSGWYVGGVLNLSPKYKNEQLTVHLLQENGEIVGVSMTGGFTKQFRQGRSDLVQDMLGKFVKFTGLAKIDTGKGNPFMPIEVKEVPAPANMPNIDFELVPAVDYTTFDKESFAKSAPSIPKAEDILSSNGSEEVPGVDEELKSMF